MQNRQSRALESLHNARAFLDANAEALPTVASSGMRQKLERTIDELTTHADAQGHHELVALGTTQQARNRRTSLLRNHMAPIAGVAKVELRGIPPSSSFPPTRESMFSGPVTQCVRIRCCKSRDARRRNLRGAVYRTCGATRTGDSARTARRVTVRRGPVTSSQGTTAGTVGYLMPSCSR